MAEEETVEKLARMLVAKIVDDQRRGSLGTDAYRATMNIAYRQAAGLEDLLKLAKSFNEK